MQMLSSGPQAGEPMGSDRQARGGARTPGHLHQERQRRTKRFSLRFHKRTLVHLERLLGRQGKEADARARPAAPTAHTPQTADLVRTLLKPLSLRLLSPHTCSRATRVLSVTGHGHRDSLVAEAGARPTARGLGVQQQDPTWAPRGGAEEGPRHARMLRWHQATRGGRRLGWTRVPQHVRASPG